MAKRKYPICSSPGRYLAGKIQGDRQILMGVSCPNFELHYFDTCGNYLNSETRELTIPPTKRDGIYFFDSVADAALTADIERWSEELEFIENRIDILQFEANDTYIEDLPGDVLDLEENPNNFTAEDRKELLALREDWIKSGMFAFWWGDELWIDREGFVNSS